MAGKGITEHLDKGLGYIITQNAREKAQERLKLLKIREQQEITQKTLTISRLDDKTIVIYSGECDFATSLLGKRGKLEATTAQR